MTQEEKIKEVMELVGVYASLSESFPAYATLSEVKDAENAIETKLRELIKEQK